MKTGYYWHHASDDNNDVTCEEAGWEMLFFDEICDTYYRMASLRPFDKAELHGHVLIKAVMPA